MQKDDTHSSHSQRELAHRVKSVRAPVNQLLHELWDLGSSSPLLRETLGLLGSGDLSSKEQPEETLWEGLRASRSSGELSLALGDGEATESDTLVGVQDGTFPDEALESIRLSLLASCLLFFWMIVRVRRMRRKGDEV